MHKLNLQLLTAVLIAFLACCGSTTSHMELSRRFVKDQDGVIQDLVTGMQWRVSPQSRLSWEEACDWVDELGGAWRMPTYNELSELWMAGVNLDYWGPFTTTSNHIWCIDPESRRSHSAFSFIPKDPLGASRPTMVGAFATKPPPGGWEIACSMN